MSNPQPIGFRRIIAGLTVTAVVTAGAVLGVAAPASAATGPAPIEQRNAATVTSDPLPTVQIDSGIVWAQVINGNTVYAGGSFSNARPAGAGEGQSLMPRTNLLAYDLTTGVATSFAPTINGAVKALAVSPDGSRLYVGGTFTQVNGQVRHNVAAFDTATGALLTTFKPAVGGSYVNAIVATQTTVYFGGLIGATAGVTRKNLSAVAASNGALLAWAPVTDRQVDTMVLAPGGDKLIIGGRFETVNGATSRGLGALDLTTGAALPWAATATIKNGLNTGSNAGKAGISQLTTDGTGAVYGTGWVYANAATGNLEGIFAADGDTGEIRWIADCHGDHYGVYSDGTNVYSTGHEHDCQTAGGMPQGSGNPGNMKHATVYTAAVKGTLSRSPSTGTTYADWSGYPAPAAVNWYPDWMVGTASGQGQAGWTATGNGEYVLIGGEFPLVNNIRSQGIARFAVAPPGGPKQGPRLADAEWAPTGKSVESGSARVQIPANWDRDDLNLSYELWQPGAAQPLTAITAQSTYWNRPTQVLGASGFAPGSAQTFYVVARDGDGNSATSGQVTITISGAAASDYASRVLTDGASLYWRLGGTNAAGHTDVAGGNNGAWGTGVGVTADDALANETNGSATFTGTSSGASRTSQPAAVGPSFAVELWFKTSTLTGGKLVGYGNSATGSSSTPDRHLYMRNSGQLVFGVYQATNKTIQSPGSYRDNQWHHAVGQMSPVGGLQLYVDGVLVASDAGANSARPITGYWRLGSDSLSGWPNQPTSSSFNGRLDEFAVYPKVLTPAQISSHYAAGAGLATPTAAFTVSGADLERQFDAGASEAPAGRTMTSYSWDFGDGASASGVTASHTYQAPGSYTVTLTVTDSAGMSASSSQSVTATAPHQPPVASFSADTTGLTATFDASASTASGSATITGYAWDFGDGQTSTLAAPTHTYGAAGTYTAVLTVTDSLGATSAPVSVDVSVAEQAFVARDDFERSTATGWGAAPTGGSWSGSTGLSVSGGAGRIALNAGQTRVTALTAVSARDIDATVVISADKVATGGGLHTNVTLHKSAAGEYRVKVRTLATGAVTVSLNKLIGTTETVLQSKTLTGYTFIADAKLRLHVTAVASGPSTILSANVWPDGTAEPAGWLLTATDAQAELQGAGQIGIAAYLTSTAGNAPVTVAVDDLAVVDTSTPAPPEHADPSASFTTAVADLAVSVDASASTASDGATLTYTWDWGDGSPSATGPTATHTYATAGAYTVTLDLLDSLGGTASTSQVVTVSAPAEGFVARDDFERSVASGWGSAVVGGAWSTSAGFSVADGVGKATLAPAQTRTNLLGGVSAATVDARAKLTTDVVANGGGLHLSYLVHKTSAGDYRLKLRISSAGVVQVSLAKMVGATETILVNKTLGGYTHVAGSRLQLRLQAISDGTSTLLNGKVWADGGTEPTDWFVTTTDTTPEVQGPGQIGLQAYLSGSATNGPVTVSVDDIEVR